MIHNCPVADGCRSVASAGSAMCSTVASTETSSRLAHSTARTTQRRRITGGGAMVVTSGFGLRTIPLWPTRGGHTSSLRILSGHTLVQSPERAAAMSGHRERLRGQDDRVVRLDPRHDGLARAPQPDIAAVE